MTSEEIKCPLCGEKLDEGNWNAGYYFCFNNNCFASESSHYRELALTKSDHEILTSQISRIKETAFKEGYLKAKQEVLDDVAYSLNQTFMRLLNDPSKSKVLEKQNMILGNFVNQFEIGFNELKKRHGVE
jgi:hypothetical protein